MKLYSFFYLALLLTTQISHASDIAKDIRQGGANPEGIEDGGFIELGLELSYSDFSSVRYSRDQDDAEVGLTLGLDYRYRGFFIELQQGSADGLNLGYNIWSNEDLSFDLLVSSINGRLDTTSEKDISGLSEAERDDALQDRNTFYNGAGVRVTRYWDNYILQYRLVTDIHDDKGLTSTLRFGRNWQVKNGNFHALLGGEYASAKTSQYWYGISEREATTLFPAYDLGSTFSFTGELGFTYPVTEKLVFRTFARYTYLPDDIQKSPLVDGDYDAFFVTSISYVF